MNKLQNSKSKLEAKKINFIAEKPKKLKTIKTPEGEKETKAMKNSNKKTAIVSVILTLATLATIAGLFIGGMKFQQHLDQQTKATVQAQVTELLKSEKK